MSAAQTQLVLLSVFFFLYGLVTLLMISKAKKKNKKYNQL